MAFLSLHAQLLCCTDSEKLQALGSDTELSLSNFEDDEDSPKSDHGINAFHKTSIPVQFGSNLVRTRFMNIYILRTKNRT